MSTATVSTLHTSWHHDDYDIAKDQIRQQLGNLDDLEIFGRQVCVACYIRPNVTKAGWYVTINQQMEDVWQGKAVLIVKCGPDAFTGDVAYLEAMFGRGGPPRVGDWVFMRSADGLQVSLCGEGAARVQGKDGAGRAVDVYAWDGWNCRIVGDEQILGRINNPHVIV